jgi:hypothetical protein
MGHAPQGFGQNISDYFIRRALYKFGAPLVNRVPYMVVFNINVFRPIVMANVLQLREASCAISANSSGNCLQRQLGKTGKVSYETVAIMPHGRPPMRRCTLLR